MAEGVILTALAAAIAPLIALPLVWLAGLLPYFWHITGGRPLPVHIGWIPFAAAGLSGLMCLAVFVIPGVLGARAGLFSQRLRSSRPPQVPVLQRYYIDVMFLAVGGVLFWELQARGELVSGSLFGQPDVNEALLIAPVVFPGNRGNAVLPSISDVRPVHQRGVADAGGHGGVGDGGGTGGGHRGDGLSSRRPDGVDSAGGRAWRVWGGVLADGQRVGLEVQGLLGLSYRRRSRDGSST